MAHLELNHGYYNLVEQLQGGKRCLRSLQTDDYVIVVQQTVSEYNAQLNTHNLAMTFWKAYQYLQESFQPPTLQKYTEAWSNFQKFITPQRNINTVTSVDIVR